MQMRSTSQWDAIHDSFICFSCGRFGLKKECRDLYNLAAGMWLKRPEGSFGRESRATASILHAD